MVLIARLAYPLSLVGRLSAMWACALLRMCRTQVCGRGNGEVAADEGRNDLDGAHGRVRLGAEDGCDGVAEVEIAVVGILELLDGEHAARAC